METATRDPVHEAEPHAGASGQVEDIDPEHDIDARATTYWLIGALVFVVVAMWVLYIVFEYSVAGARYRKIDQVAPQELHDLRAAEDALLRREEPAAGEDPRSLQEIRASIERSTDRVIADYVQAK